MNVRFKMTNKGEVAILPRKEFEALAAKALEADEDVGTARLVARARREIGAGMPLAPRMAAGLRWFGLPSLHSGKHQGIGTVARV